MCIITTLVGSCATFSSLLREFLGVLSVHSFRIYRTWCNRRTTKTKKEKKKEPGDSLRSLSIFAYRCTKALLLQMNRRLFKIAPWQFSVCLSGGSSPIALQQEGAAWANWAKWLQSTEGCRRSARWVNRATASEFRCVSLMERRRVVVLCLRFACWLKGRRENRHLKQNLKNWENFTLTERCNAHHPGAFRRYVPHTCSFFFYVCNCC